MQLLCVHQSCLSPASKPRMIDHTLLLMAYWLEIILEVGTTIKTERGESRGIAKNMLIWKFMNKNLATSVQHWVVVENVTTLTTAIEEDVGGAGNTG